MRSRGLTRWPGEGVSARKDQNLGQSLEEFQFVRAGGAAGGWRSQGKEEGATERRVREFREPDFCVVKELSSAGVVCTAWRVPCPGSAMRSLVILSPGDDCITMG